MKLRVKEICKSLKITQKELAERMGMLPESLNRVLSGGNPTLMTLQNIANSLDVNVSDLFDDEKEGIRVNGYVEVDNVIHKINSGDDLGKLYIQIKEGIKP